ncbi:MAG: PPOX class F420-dependent oxidoreductase [Actinomycetota bacterium]|nr:PPOX class F420-dependent oxidoreductase [Actinomycetota bacterium]
MIPDSHRDILEKKGLAHVATIGPTGEPHNSPVWFEWDGEHVLFSQTKTRQKYKNLLRDPRVSLSITIRTTPIAVSRSGDARRRGGGRGQRLHQRHGQEVHRRGRLPLGKPGDERIVLKVKPSHTTTMG